MKKTHRHRIFMDGKAKSWHAIGCANVALIIARICICRRANIWGANVLCANVSCAKVRLANDRTRTGSDGRTVGWTVMTSLKRQIQFFKIKI